MKMSGKTSTVISFGLIPTNLSFYNLSAHNPLKVILFALQTVIFLDKSKSYILTCSQSYIIFAITYPMGNITLRSKI